MKWTLNIQVFFAWYDAWVGIYIDRKKRRVYVLPLPCCGICFGWGPKWERGVFGKMTAQRHWFTGRVYLEGSGVPVDHPEMFERGPREHFLGKDMEQVRRALDRHEREAIRTGTGALQRKKKT
jgi:hypothetical protein